MANENSHRSKREDLLDRQMADKKQEIEEVRRKLHHMVAAKEGQLRHEEVARLSVELDYLIVDYEKLKAQQGKNSPR